MKPGHLKFLLNFFGPYVGAGVRIEKVSDDWRYCRVGMKLRWYNKNAVSTHFGGSLYSMVDPHYMLLLMQCLGKEYTVWDKSAHIDFVKPGKGYVWAEFEITDAMLAEIKEKTADGEKFLPVFKVEVKDSQGDIVSIMKKTLYIRKKPQQGRRV